MHLLPYAKVVFSPSKLCEMPSRRLEDKIRHLCALATVAKDADAWLIMSELRLLIRQHIGHLRMVAAGKLSGAREFAERRADRRPA
jgi:hypothetical protein